MGRFTKSELISGKGIKEMSAIDYYTQASQLEDKNIDIGDETRGALL